MRSLSKKHHNKVSAAQHEGAIESPRQDESYPMEYDQTWHDVEVAFDEHPVDEYFHGYSVPRIEEPYLARTSHDYSPPEASTITSQPSLSHNQQQTDYYQDQNIVSSSNYDYNATYGNVDAGGYTDYHYNSNTTGGYDAADDYESGDIAESLQGVHLTSSASQYHDTAEPQYPDTTDPQYVSNADSQYDGNPVPQHGGNPPSSKDKGKRRASRKIRRKDYERTLHIYSDIIDDYTAVEAFIDTGNNLGNIIADNTLYRMGFGHENFDWTRTKHVKMGGASFLTFGSIILPSRDDDDETYEIEFSVIDETRMPVLKKRKYEALLTPEDSDPDEDNTVLVIMESKRRVTEGKS